MPPPPIKIITKLLLFLRGWRDTRPAGDARDAHTHAHVMVFQIIDSKPFILIKASASLVIKPPPSLVIKFFNLCQKSPTTSYDAYRTRQTS